jgi:gamma-glutamylcyclotransferase (GGCT)/AIG2-like uncharacterized protein YtfP
VYGELLTFDDPETRLPTVDRLESFHPGGRSLYRRVLVPVYAGKELIPAWLYVGGQLSEGRMTPTGDSSWQSPNQSV